MGDSAAGVNGRDRNSGPGSFGSDSPLSGNNYQTMRARGRSGDLRGSGNAGRSEDCVYGIEKTPHTAPKRDIGKEITIRIGSTSKTGNNPAAPQQMRSKPSSSEKYTGRDGGHANPQSGKSRSGSRMG